MRAAAAKSAFPSEAALCDCFIESLQLVEGWTAYPETAGFDILAVYRTGHQLGIEAKLQLNAKVADQILPSHHFGYREDRGVPGPDFRAVIVPCITDASEGIAKMLRILGVQVWTPSETHSRGTRFEFGEFSKRGSFAVDRRAYDTADGQLMEWDMAWHDWNPPARCELPEFVPSVRAGVPAPIQLTPWKVGALKVMAQLEVEGFVTAQAVRHCNVDPRRFCASDGWLAPLGGGRWGRGPHLPSFDQQHPVEYQQILAAARDARRAAA